MFCCFCDFVGGLFGGLDWLFELVSLDFVMLETWVCLMCCLDLVLLPLFC